MAFTEFLPRADMRARELEHCAMIALPLHVASLIRDELGDASYRGSQFASWYGDAVIHRDDRKTISCPFALRIDMRGNASMQVRWCEAEHVAGAIVSLVPALLADVIPMQDRGYRRMGRAA